MGTIYETSVDEGHLHLWDEESQTTTMADGHSHKIDKGFKIALPAGINNHTHRLLLKEPNGE